MINNGKYRFYIFWIDNGGWYIIKEIKPVNANELNIVYTNKYNQRFLTRDLSGEVKLINDASNNIFDFDLIRNIENGVAGYPDKCSNIYFGIDKNCGSWNIDTSPQVYNSKTGGNKPVWYWQGVFSIINASFDLDRCVVTISPYVVDEYACLSRIWENDYNVVDSNSTVIKSETPVIWEYYNCPEILLSDPDFIGTYDAFGCLQPRVTSFEPDWYNDCNNLVANHYKIDTQSYRSTPFPFTFYVATNWKRWITYTVGGGGVNPPPTGVWHYLNNETINGVIFSKFVRDNTDYYAISGGKIIGTCNNFTWKCNYGEFVYQTAKKIDTIILDMLTGCNLTFKSEFFENEINYVTNQINKLNNIYFIPKSDYLNPNATMPQRFASLSLKRLLEIICDTFNCYWWIENNELRIEHVSYNLNMQGIDAMSDYPENLKGHRKYRYNVENMFSVESWKFMEQGNIDFIGSDIKYISTCVKKDTENKVKDRDLNEITTDIALIYTSPELISSSGFVMVCTRLINGENWIDSEVGVISNNLLPNGHLSIANLHENYWRYERIAYDGEMNGLQTVFTTIQKFKELEEIRLPLCCTEFDSEKLINTGLGWGEVYEAREILKTGIFVIKLKYE